MCELFGVSSREKRDYSVMLREFFSHSDLNPHGFGVALFRDGAPEIIKEPVNASESKTLERILEEPVEEDLLLAHIRLATKGQISFDNTHPFAVSDAAGTSWTLVHNGTIFESTELSSYYPFQSGETDSERILLCLVDRMDREGASASDRIRVVDELLKRITPENKVNVLISDGSLLYAHCNFRGSMYMKRKDGEILVSSRPLGDDDWDELPLNTLLVFRDGEQIYEGTPHENEFFETEEKMKFLFLDYSGM